MLACPINEQGWLHNRRLGACGLIWHFRVGEAHRLYYPAPLASPTKNKYGGGCLRSRGCGILFEQRSGYELLELNFRMTATAAFKHRNHPRLDGGVSPSRIDSEQKQALDGFVLHLVGDGAITHQERSHTGTQISPSQFEDLPRLETYTKRQERLCDGQVRDKTLPEAFPKMVHHPSTWSADTLRPEDFIRQLAREDIQEIEGALQSLKGIVRRSS
jgi:hypothetical protein